MGARIGILIIFSIQVVVTSVAFGGQFETCIRHTSGSNVGQGAQLDLTSPELSMIRNGTGIQYSIKAPETFLVKLNVSLSQVPPNFKASEFQIDMPYYWEEKHSQKICGSLTNDPTDDYNVERLAKKVKEVSWNNIETVVLYNTKLTYVYQVRKAEIDNGLAPRAVDLQIAFWLAFTARELADRINVVPAELAQDAVSYLKSAKATALYKSALIDDSKVVEISQRFEQHASIVYSNILAQMEKTLSSSVGLRKRTQDFSKACRRSEALFNTVRNLADDEYANIAPRFSVHVRAADVAALCLFYRLQDQPTSQQYISAPDEALYHQINDDFKRLLLELNDDRLKGNVVNRMNELTAIYAKFAQ